MSILAVLLLAAPAFAMRQGAPPMPKVSPPGGWPIAGYLVAGALFVGAVWLSLLSSNRADPDSGEIS